MLQNQARWIMGVGGVRCQRIWLTKPPVTCKHFIFVSIFSPFSFLLSSFVMINLCAFIFLFWCVYIIDFHFQLPWGFDIIFVYTWFPTFALCLPLLMSFSICNFLVSTGSLVKNFLNIGKEIVNQVQEAQRVPGRTNPRRNTPRHIVITLTKIKDRDTTLKTTRGKWQIMYKGTPIRLSAGFSTENLQTRRK